MQYEQAQDSLQRWYLSHKNTSEEGMIDRYVFAPPPVLWIFGVSCTAGPSHFRASFDGILFLARCVLLVDSYQLAVGQDCGANEFRM